MKPLVINNQIKLPYPTRAGHLCVGDCFRLNESSALHRVTRKLPERIISVKVRTPNRSAFTDNNYPVIQYI
jgi:hypothetical protein